MINKIKNKLASSDNRKITSNFLALSVLQGANFLLPLLTFPYLVRVLGVDKFGLVMFAQAFMVYFTMLAEYGFNLSGTREISTHRNNHTRVVQIFSSIMLARLILILVGFIAMNIIVFSFEKFAQNWLLYYATYGMVVGTALFPVWFFQGVEKMKYISILSLVAKSIFTISIFIFVNETSDYIYVPLINALGYIVVGIISLFIIQKDFHVAIQIQPLKRIKIQFLRGWNIFISKISINLYTATNTFILGVFTNETTVGYYAIAEKVVRIVTSLFAPFYQAIYPYIVALVKKSKKSSKQFINKVFFYTFFISLFIWTVLYVFSGTLFNIIFGSHVAVSIELFKILSPLIVILPVAYLLFNVVLLSYKMDKYFSKIYMAGGVLNILFLVLFFLISNNKALAVSYALLLSETIITLFAIKLLVKHNILWKESVI